MFLILSLVFLPRLGAIDIANTQWLYLSLLPIFFIKTSLNFNFIRSKIFLLYSFFILQILISLTYTNNFSISIVDFSRHLVLFLSLLVLLLLLNSAKFSFYRVSLLVSFFLLYEVFVSLYPFFKFMLDNRFDFSILTSINIDSLKGLAGNRNITTASIVIKLPFLIYLIFNSRVAYQFILSFLLFIICLPLFLITSRAALLSFIFIFSVFFLFIIIFHFKKSYSLFFIVLPLLFSFLFSNFIIPDSNSQASQRISSITLSNESSSHRFFLWENAIDYITQNPFIGSGIGNWKVESSAYWGAYGNDYLVPFHAHNDFLEFATELGIIGGLSYLLLFSLLILKPVIAYLRTKDFKFLILFSSAIALFVDSFLNFPFERPIIQAMFLLLLALNIYYDYKNETN